MLNKNPLWRYLVVLGLLLLALVYALPNLYPEQPALNISASRGGELTPSLVKQLANEFDRAGLNPQALDLDNGQLVVRQQHRHAGCTTGKTPTCLPWGSRVPRLAHPVRHRRRP